MRGEKFLIKNTTREQREEIVRQSLSCGQGTCDGCSSCDGVFGMEDPETFYAPYINGEKELYELTQEFNARYFVRDAGNQHSAG